MWMVRSAVPTSRYMTGGWAYAPPQQKLSFFIVLVIVSVAAVVAHILDTAMFLLIIIACSNVEAASAGSCVAGTSVVDLCAIILFLLQVTLLLYKLDFIPHGKTTALYSRKCCAFCKHGQGVQFMLCGTMPLKWSVFALVVSFVILASFSCSFRSLNCGTALRTVTSNCSQTGRVQSLHFCLARFTIFIISKKAKLNGITRASSCCEAGTGIQQLRLPSVTSSWQKQF